MYKVNHLFRPIVSVDLCIVSELKQTKQKDTIDLLAILRKNLNRTMF